MDPISAYGQPNAVLLSWEIPLECAGMRADRYLALKVGRLSRERIQKLIRKGDFRGEKGPLKPSHRLKAGEIVQLWRIPPDSESDAILEPAVILEDSEVLILNKPAGLSIHPSARYLYRTRTYWLRKQGAGPPLAHPCHRLDRETSGVVLCAKTKPVESSLKTQFMHGQINKWYLAIVSGKPPHQFDMRFPLALQGERGLVHIRMVNDPEGLPSETLAQRIAWDPKTNRSLILCEPKTGRQHQIRVHLAELGFPIVGDKLYEMGDAYFDAFTKGTPEVENIPLAHERHALHAWQIAFRLESGQSNAVAPIPEDFQLLLSQPVFEEAEAALSKLTISPIDC